MSVLRNTLSGSKNAVNDARPYVAGVGYDVIIAGAGPVGLFLACELRLSKLSVLVLEQLADPHSPLKRLPFGLRGLWGPSIDPLYRRGLLQQVAAQPNDGKAAGLPRPSSIASASQHHGPGGPPPGGPGGPPPGK